MSFRTQGPIRPAQTPEIVMEFILMGVLGLSLLVGTVEIEVTTSIPEMTLPNTGCFDGPGLNQSKFLLFATLMKNCDPPEFGWPVLAMERDPGSLLSLEMFSSWMLPPRVRFSIAPDFKFLNSPSGGLPVPAEGPH